MNIYQNSGRERALFAELNHKRKVGVNRQEEQLRDYCGVGLGTSLAEGRWGISFSTSKYGPNKRWTQIGQKEQPQGAAGMERKIAEGCWGIMSFISANEVVLCGSEKRASEAIRQKEQPQGAAGISGAAEVPLGLQTFRLTPFGRRINFGGIKIDIQMRLELFKVENEMARETSRPLRSHSLPFPASGVKSDFVAIFPWVKTHGYHKKNRRNAARKMWCGSKTIDCNKTGVSPRY